MLPIFSKQIPRWPRASVSLTLYALLTIIDLFAAKAQNTRAARRATSPSVNVDKSLTSLPRAESPTAQRPSVLADRASAGVQKRQKQKRQTRSQRLRQEKGMDRAEAVLDQMEIKKNKSLDRARNIKTRRV